MIVSEVFAHLPAWMRWNDIRHVDLTRANGLNKSRTNLYYVGLNLNTLTIACNTVYNKMLDCDKTDACPALIAYVACSVVGVVISRHFALFVHPGSHSIYQNRVHVKSVVSVRETDGEVEARGGGGGAGMMGVDQGGGLPITQSLSLLQPSTRSHTPYVLPYW